MRLTNTGVISDPSEIARLREEFRAVNCVRIPQLLDTSLLDFLQRRLVQCEWKSKSHEGIGLEYITEDQAALHVCHFVTNLEGFREEIEVMTGCGPLNLFRGRIYRMGSGVGHYDNWHDDNMEHRLVGMSVNLSPHGFSGGHFLMRDRDSGEMLADIANTGFGDALIFRISHELQHRVSDVEQGPPKTAFAGWFRPAPVGFLEGVVRHAKGEWEEASSVFKA